MELEEIVKRLEWLDEERRNDKTTIATLEKRLAAVEGTATNLRGEVKSQDTEIARLASMQARFDQIDAAIAQVKVDLGRGVEPLEQQGAENHKEIEKVRRETQETAKKIPELKKATEGIPDIKKSLQARVEEEFRLSKLLAELQEKLNESLRLDEEFRRSIHLSEETQRQDSKRLTDLQGEVSVLRKRSDEYRGKQDVLAETLKKLDTRINEIQASEAERRQLQNTLIEKQALLQVERDRVWKEWETQFAKINQSAEAFDTQLQSLDNVQRALKRTQASYEDINQRLERRINEITEMQRLTEDRFRQEWMTFKSEDAKRWTNYTLSQEEQLHDILQQIKLLVDRVTGLEDLATDLHEMQSYLTDEDQKHLQFLINTLNEWTEDSKQATRKPRKGRKS
jgi:chromosome segregation ATPase